MYYQANNVITQFATEWWSLPEAHAHLQKHLGNHYLASEWNESLDSVLRAEDNIGAALAALCNKWAACNQMCWVWFCSEVAIVGLFAG